MSVEALIATTQADKQDQPADNARLKEAAGAFESLFLEMMLKQMREAQLEEGFFGGGTGSDTYQAMFDRNMADSMALNSPLGIGDRLYDSWIAAGYGGDKANEVLRQLHADGNSIDHAAPTSRPTPTPEPTAVPVEVAAPSAPTKMTRPSEDGISRPYGFGHDPINGRWRFHGGVDLPARTGTGVLAVAPGRVEQVEEHGGYGLQVLIRHADGWTTRYAHLSSAEVQKGQWVGRGSRLGAVGNSGRSTGPHLHFETAKNNQKIDPSVAAPGLIRPQVLEQVADKVNDRDRSPGVRADSVSRRE